MEFTADIHSFLKIICMFNPCYPFTSELLESMVQKEVLYFVRSTYTRGIIPNQQENIKGSFLISHYHDLAEAERHYNAIQHDPFRFLYDARKPEHLEKLRVAASQPASYSIYSKIIIPNIIKKVTVLFKENTKRYLHKKTDWDLKGKVTITPLLYFQLGELYIRITYMGDEIKIKFEEIENA